jgi:hypothetical protein
MHIATMDGEKNVHITTTEVANKAIIDKFQCKEMV